MSSTTVFAANTASSIDLQNLTCEQLPNPNGIDTVRPRLSWILQSDRHNQRQTAYRVLVASSRARLDGGVGDLWDSGKVASDQSIFVEYDGKPLGRIKTATGR